MQVENKNPDEPKNKMKKKKKPEPGYLGGIASMGASLLTHPLDTVKVQLQTQTSNVKKGLIAMTVSTVKSNGVLSLYNGISAALLRQGTYSTARFAFYEFAKEQLMERSHVESKSAALKNLPFYQKVIIAGIGGGIGSIFGSPADLINVRMQNDTRLPLDKRRNYKHCFEALYRITRDEGFLSLYAGFHMATLRGILVTVGQLAFYDEFKHDLIKTKYFEDNFVTHFTASMAAGLIATLITMPADVIKTLLMNAKPGEISGVTGAIRMALSNDKLGLFRGFWPRYIRLGPFTILSFVFYEKLKVVERRITDKF